MNYDTKMKCHVEQSETPMYLYGELHRSFALLRVTEVEFTAKLPDAILECRGKIVQTIILLRKCSASVPRKLLSIHAERFRVGSVNSACRALSSCSRSLVS